jgi:predicted enzyme related to lactoylglutathione lyase
MDAAVAFYGDVLGLTLIRRAGGEWAEFDSGTAVRLALHGATHGAGMPQPGGATVVLRVDDLETARRRLEARGAPFDEAVGEVEGFARFATFRDPDGNAIQIIEYAPHP